MSFKVNTIQKNFVIDKKRSASYNESMNMNHPVNSMINKKNAVKICFSFLIPFFVILIRPLGFSMNQAVITGFLFMILLWWSTNWVRQEISSVLLIVIFIFFGKTSLAEVFYFPRSDSFIMVACSYLISQGIVNSGAAHYLSARVLNRFCTNARQLALLSYLLCTILIFFIPHPFPRVIMLSSLYIIFLQNQQISEESRSVLLFSIASAATVTALMFLSGDIMANYAALGFGNVSISHFDWIKYMTLPGIAATILAAFTFIYAFRKSLKAEFTAPVNSAAYTPDCKKAIVIMSLMTAFWLSEKWSGIPSAFVIIAGVVLMLHTGLLSRNDFKAINIKVLLFLTAQFSIGKVLVGSGTAEIFRKSLSAFFPDGNSACLIPFIIFLIMCLHMLLGSLITTLSISIPMLVILTSGTFPPEFIVLLACVCTYYHVLLPFHQVTVVIGFANQYYKTRHVLILGVYLTVLTVLCTFFIYIPWWRVTGLL
jgi:sodium-dependent dicarboxylate transporter 2/3/5